MPPPDAPVTHDPPNSRAEQARMDTSTVIIRWPRLTAGVWSWCWRREAWAPCAADRLKKTPALPSLSLSVCPYSPSRFFATVLVSIAPYYSVLFVAFTFSCFPYSFILISPCTSRLMFIKLLVMQVQRNFLPHILKLPSHLSSLAVQVTPVRLPTRSALVGTTLSTGWAGGARFL